MKKQKIEKIKKIWSKVKKPLMIISIIGNIIFILSLFIGCSNLNKNKNVSQVGATDTYERHTLQGVTDLAGLTLYVPDTPYPYGKLEDFYGWGDNNAKNLSFTTDYDPEKEFLHFVTAGQDVVGDYYTACYFLQYWTTNDTNNTDNRTRAYASAQCHADNPAAPNGWADPGLKVLHFSRSSNSTNSTTIDMFDLMGCTLTDPNLPPPEPGDYEPLENLYLGDNFLPSVYVSQGGDFILNGFAGRNSSADTHNMLLNGFTFSSNGEIFNQIRLIYGSLNATSMYVTEDGSTLLDVSSYGNYMVCVGIKYEYVQDNNVISSVLVCSPRRTLINSGGTTYKVFDVRPPFNVWVNDLYRNLEIIEDTQSIISDSYLQYSGKTAIQLLQVTSNASQQVMGFTNVFALMSSAFAGLASILGITILPGITIGLLLFIPLIVVIIITVIKLIKK